MVTKILNALKQEYAHLGLGDSFLSGHASMLANLGVVTDENLSSIVAAQKSYLEGVQKSNDKRVQDAVGKTQREAEEKANAAKTASDKALADLQKQFDDFKAAHPDKQKETPKEDEMPDWYKREKAEREKREKEWQDQLKSLTDAKSAAEQQLNDIKTEREKAEAQRAAEQRKSTIAAKAKEKGIPDWMIAHGFADITADTSDEQIDTILSGIAQEVQTNFLPKKGGSPQVSDKTATKADTDAIVAKLKI